MVDVFVHQFQPNKNSPKKCPHQNNLIQTYTTWKVDGATPMYWFIINPLLFATELGSGVTSQSTHLLSWKSVNVGNLCPSKKQHLQETDHKNNTNVSTLPKTNITSENGLSQKKTSIPTINFQVRTPSFREGTPPKKKSLATELSFETSTIIFVSDNQVIFHMYTMYTICILKFHDWCLWNTVFLESPHSFLETLGQQSLKRGMFLRVLTKCGPILSIPQYPDPSKLAILRTLFLPLEGSSWSLGIKKRQVSIFTSPKVSRSQPSPPVGLICFSNSCNGVMCCTWKKGGWWLMGTPG